MRFSARVVPVARGHHGPFANDKGTEREGRTIPYLSVTTTDGGEPISATVAEGVDLSGLAMLSPAVLEFDLYKANDGKLKLRVVGQSAASELPQAA